MPSASCSCHCHHCSTSRIGNLDFQSVASKFTSNSSSLKVPQFHSMSCRFSNSPSLFNCPHLLCRRMPGLLCQLSSRRRDLSGSSWTLSMSSSTAICRRLWMSTELWSSSQSPSTIQANSLTSRARHASSNFQSYIKRPFLLGDLNVCNSPSPVETSYRLKTRRSRCLSLGFYRVAK